MYRVIVLCFYTVFLSYFTSCCKDDNKSKDGVIWKNRINGKDLIGNVGLGYPRYNNTVVFHSTPDPTDNDENSVIYGLDTETGKEKWRLTNADFLPKKNLELSCTFGTYQKNNILIGCDKIYKPLNTDTERYIYGIDIDKGKVLWVTQFPAEYDRLGNMIKGAGQYAYVNATSDTKISLLRVDIEQAYFHRLLMFLIM